MLSASAGLFVVDFIFRPFAKIWEKSPPTILLITMLLYGIIGYIVIKSVYLADQK